MACPSHDPEAATYCQCAVYFAYMHVFTVTVDPEASMYDQGAVYFAYMHVLLFFITHCRSLAAYQLRVVLFTCWIHVTLASKKCLDPP